MPQYPPTQHGIATARPAARLIVCEREGRWAAALRRELAAEGVRVWETRGLDGLREELATSPASLAVLELPADPTAAFAFAERMERDFPAARLVMVARREQAGYELPLREAGAVDFLTTTRRAPRLARLACRHLARAPQPSRSFAEQVWASLPWA
jgi:DNA-binding response OmpR family regulator